MSEGTHECRNCVGKQTKTRYSYYECDNCGEPIGKVQSTPDEDLRELVEQWRSGDVRNHPGVDIRSLNMCVEQLEAVLEE